MEQFDEGLCVLHIFKSSGVALGWGYLVILYFARIWLSSLIEGEYEVNFAVFWSLSSFWSVVTWEILIFFIVDWFFDNFRVEDQKFYIKTGLLKRKLAPAYNHRLVAWEQRYSYLFSIVSFNSFNFSFQGFGHRCW